MVPWSTASNAIAPAPIESIKAGISQNQTLAMVMLERMLPETVPHPKGVRIREF